MAESRDRRSTTGAKDPAAEPESEGQGSKLDLTAGGRMRRTPDGGRGIMDYFNGDNRNKPVSRGELLGFLEMVEFSREQCVWYRSFWRWLFRRPGPADMPRGMAMAYAKRSLKRAVDAVAAELERRGETIAAAKKEGL